MQICLKWNGNITLLTEGDGRNLSDEDVEAGFCDYFMEETIDTVDGMDDGGMWLLTQNLQELFQNEKELIEYFFLEVHGFRTMPEYEIIQVEEFYAL